MSTSTTRVLITGGAGFIGTNLAHRLLSMGRRVIILDNLARSGSERNLDWLYKEHGAAFDFHQGDIRNRNSVRRAMAGVDQVFHLAAQVAVTTSLTDAIQDFEVNARGTLNLLEEIRTSRNCHGLVFTSTNKVYGQLADLDMRAVDSRYEPADSTIRQTGINEHRALEFHSPYGCSKGAADQYVLDYARSFGLKAVVFRMSCIYGPHQYGNEDQGWVAHFLICGLDGLPITLYGDGRQVRDILYVEDLIDAFLLAEKRMEEVAGQAFNIGGGPENTVSLRELLRLMEALPGVGITTRTSDWRTADQRYYVSDTRKFEAATGWKREFDLRTGVRNLYDWLAQSRQHVVPATESLVAGANQGSAV